MPHSWRSEPLGGGRPQRGGECPLRSGEGSAVARGCEYWPVRNLAPVPGRCTPHTLIHQTHVATQAAPLPASVDVDEAVPYRWLILLGLITAAIMEVLDTTIINVALPQMAGNLGATHEEIAWVSTSYILANVVVLPMTAFFTRALRARNYLTFSILLFIVASFLCGTSHSLGELVLWRLLQGAGGAALLSTAQATIRQIFPREQQGMVQADLPPRHHRRADARPHARRLDHRQLHLELVLLHQHSDRHRRRPSS